MLPLWPLDWRVRSIAPNGRRATKDSRGTLLHEFDEAHDRFDWHVDTKPNDGKARTTNLNVMLSEPRVDFGGGALQVQPHNVPSACAPATRHRTRPQRPHVVAPVAPACGARWWWRSTRRRTTTAPSIFARRSERFACLGRGRAPGTSRSSHGRCAASSSRLRPRRRREARVLRVLPRHRRRRRDARRFLADGRDERGCRPHGRRQRIFSDGAVHEP